MMCTDRGVVFDFEAGAGEGGMGDKHARIEGSNYSFF